MKRSKAEKLLRDSYIHSINECLFVLGAIRNSFDPVPECLDETIHIVEWVYDGMMDDE